MPFPSEHSARMIDPEKCQQDSFRRVNDKFGAGIHAIMAKLMGETAMKVQAVRFDAKKFSVSEAKKWLDEHDMEPIVFEPATGEEEKMKQGIFMRSMETGSDECVIDIVGEIGWAIWYPQFLSLLKTVPENAKRVVFSIYSPGGDVWEGNAIIQAIGAMKKNTVARVQLAASMATLIAMACQRREMASNGRWLIHNPWTQLAGDAAALEKRAKELRDCEQEAAQFYSQRTLQTKEKMLELMAEERWLVPEEAFVLGFIHEIKDPFSIEDFAGVKSELKAAGKWPKALVAMEGIKNDETTDGAATTKNAAVVSSTITADAAGECAEYQRGYTEGRADERAESEPAHTAKILEISGPIAELKAQITALDSNSRKFQGERDAARASVEKLTATLAEANARLEKLLAGGMRFTPAIETWEQAMKACEGDYEKARKTYPDVYHQQREQDRLNRSKGATMKKVGLFLAALLAGAGLSWGQSTVGSYSAPQLVVEINRALANPTNNALVVNNATIRTNATIGGTLAVTGVATLVSTPVLRNGLTVQTNATIGGTLTVTGVTTLVSTPVLQNGLTVQTNATVGGTLSVTGVASFTAESVHNGGVDADYITTDAGLGIDAKTAGKLAVGTNTATSIDYGSASVTAHTFLSDATGTGEVVLPNESIGDAEIAAVSAAKLSAGTVATAIDGNAITNLDASDLLTGTVPNARLDADLQPLADDDAGGLTNIVSGGIVSLDAAKLQATTVATAIDGSAITNLAGGSIASGTVPNARLDVDLAKLADNDAGSLTNVVDAGIIGMSAAKLTAATVATAIDGSAITNLNGANIASGDIASARLTANAVVVTDFGAANQVLVGSGSGTFAATTGSGAIVVTNASTLSTNRMYFSAGGILASNVYDGP